MLVLCLCREREKGGFWVVMGWCGGKRTERKMEMEESWLWLWLWLCLHT